jgi:hypothetical protein
LLAPAFVFWPDWLNSLPIVLRGNGLQTSRKGVREIAHDLEEIQAICTIKISFCRGVLFPRHVLKTEMIPKAKRRAVDLLTF